MTSFSCGGAQTNCARRASARPEALGGRGLGCCAPAEAEARLGGPGAPLGGGQAPAPGARPQHARHLHPVRQALALEKDAEGRERELGEVQGSRLYRGLGVAKVTGDCQEKPLPLLHCRCVHGGGGDGPCPPWASQSPRSKHPLSPPCSDPHPHPVSHSSPSPIPHYHPHPGPGSGF